MPDKTSPFVELRDMTEVLPFDRASEILREQQLNPYDRIKDVTLQRAAMVNKVFARFDDTLRRLERQELEERPLIVRGDAPLRIVVADHQVIVRPGTAHALELRHGWAGHGPDCRLTAWKIRTPHCYRSAAQAPARGLARTRRTPSCCGAAQAGRPTGS